MAHFSRLNGRKESTNFVSFSEAVTVSLAVKNKNKTKNSLTCGKLPFAIILLAVRPSGSVPTDGNNGLRVLFCALVLLYTATADIVVCVVLASDVGVGFVC